VIIAARNIKVGEKDIVPVNVPNNTVEII